MESSQTTKITFSRKTIYSREIEQTTKILFKNLGCTVYDTHMHNNKSIYYAVKYSHGTELNYFLESVVKILRMHSI